MDSASTNLGKAESFTLITTPEDVQAAQELHKQEQRSVSSYIRMISYVFITVNS